MGELQQIRNVHIWDDPESKIRLLETSLGPNQAWRATIHSVSGATDAPDLHAIKKSLDSEGKYITEITSDKYGHPVLNIQKIGVESSFINNIGKLGLINGMRHSFLNVSYGLAELANSAKKIVAFWTENKAKRIGLLYLMGDMIITSNAATDNSPEKILKTTYGILGSLQSLIFMNFATEADSQLSKEISRKFANQYNGLTIDTSLDWLQQEESSGKFLQTMEKYAIPIGAWTQIIGRLAWATAGVREIQRGAKGGWERISDSAMSIFGWVLFMLKSDGTKKENEPAAVEWLKRNSNRIGGILNAGSTFAGLKGAFSKIDDGEEARSDLVGNLTYLLGDVTVFVTNTMDYDAKSAVHPATLARIATNFMDSLPVILGPEAKLTIATKLSKYLAKRVQEIQQKKGEVGIAPDELPQYENDIYNAMLSLAPNDNIGLSEISAKAADIVMLFPQEKHREIIASLAKAMSKIPSVLATQDEITQLVEQAIALKKPVQRTKFVQTRDVQAPIADLIKMLPSTPNQPETAICIYNSVQPFLSRNQEQDKKYFSISMEQLFERYAKSTVATQQNAGANIMH